MKKIPWSSVHKGRLIFYRSSWYVVSMFILQFSVNSYQLNLCLQGSHNEVTLGNLDSFDECSWHHCYLISIVSIWRDKCLKVNAYSSTGFGPVYRAKVWYLWTRNFSLFWAFTNLASLIVISNAFASLGEFFICFFYNWTITTLGLSS